MAATPLSSGHRPLRDKARQRGARWVSDPHVVNRNATAGSPGPPTPRRQRLSHPNRILRPGLTSTTSASEPQAKREPSWQGFVDARDHTWALRMRPKITPAAPSADGFPRYDALLAAPGRVQRTLQRALVDPLLMLRSWHTKPMAIDTRAGARALGASGRDFPSVAIPARWIGLPLTADCRSSTKARDARPARNAGPPGATTTSLPLANLAHRRVIDQSVNPAARPEDLLSVGGAYEPRPARDGATAPLSCGETSLGSDWTSPARRHKRASGACRSVANASVKAVAGAGSRSRSQRAAEDRQRDQTGAAPIAQQQVSDAPAPD